MQTKSIFILSSNILAILFLILPIYSSATIYQHVDSQGNIIYSDKAVPGSTQIKLKEEQALTWRPTQQQQQTTATTTTATTTGTQATSQGQLLTPQISISSPTPEQYIRSNQGALQVAAELNFQLKPGNSIQVYIDGAPFGEPQYTAQFIIEGILRGIHDIQLVVVDRGGNEIARSNTVRFFMYRNIVRVPPAPPNT